MENLEKKFKNIFNKIKGGSLALIVSLPLVIGNPSQAVAQNLPTNLNNQITIPNLNPTAPQNYGNNLPPNNYNFNRVLIMGVGRTQTPLNHQNYFDKIIPLSNNGNVGVDLLKATGEHLGFPLGSTDLKQLHGQKINEIYAHSWGADAVVNGIKSGNIQTDKLILIDPPGAYRDLKLSGTKVDIYVSDQSSFKYLPEVKIWEGNTGEPVIGMGYTFKFDNGKSNIHYINADHSLDNCLEAIIDFNPKNGQSLDPIPKSIIPTIDNPAPKGLEIYNLDNLGVYKINLYKSVLKVPEFSPTTNITPPKIPKTIILKKIISK